MQDGAVEMRPKSEGMETRRRAGASVDSSAPPPVAPLAATVAMTMTFAVAAFGAVLALTLLLVEPSPVPGLEPLGQRQDAESLLYVVAFALVVPAALVLVPRIADRIARGSNAAGLPVLAALLAAGLMASLVVARVLPGEGPGGALAMLSLWWVAAAAVLVRTLRTPSWALLQRATSITRIAWVAAGALVLAAVLAFSPLDSISPIPLAVGGLVARAVLALWWRRGGAGLPRPSGRWGLAIDAAIVLLVVLATPDLVIFSSPGEGDSTATFMASVIQFHQDFLLGPANQLLAGDAVLVDTSSQYGVAPIYLLGGWFQLAPIGYGTLGLLDGILYALLFVTGYCTLRLAGTSRPLAGAALALAVVALIYNLLYPVGGLLQHGPLRFGLPMAVVLAAVVEARGGRGSRGASIAQLLVVGLSSVWALEAFAYTAATFAGIACFQAWSRPEPGRLRWLVRRAGLAVGACLAAHVLLAAATLAFAGELPDWGLYLDYLDALLVGRLADITYDFSAWAPGLAVGVAYGASAIALVLVTLRRTAIVERERPAMIALAGTTAYGIALFTYFVNRSADDILPFVSFPALLAGAMWLSLLLRGALTSSRPAQLGGFAFALATALLVLSTAWSSVSERFPNSALAHAAPGGRSLTGALDRLWDHPVIDPRSPQGEGVVDQYFPGQRRIPLIVSPDLSIEILMRSERANELPFGHPVQDFFAGRPDVPVMQAAVDDLAAGDRILVQESGLAVLDVLEADPARDPLEEQVPVESPDALTAQQQWLLDRIGERFELRIIHRDDAGFVVAELVPRAS